MKLLAFSKRTVKEILRDPLNLFFGLGFPLILLVLLSMIQANIPVPMFEIAHLAPGVMVFGLSFLTLFTSLLLARDRESALLQRLYTAPLTAADFLLGYLLPTLPIALGQSAVCALASLALGLRPTLHLLWTVLFTLPAALFYISLGLVFGSILNVKAVGGVCGALLTNLSAWLSGIWFDVALVGGWFEKLANLLPFIHAVELERAVLLGDFTAGLPHLWWVLGYAAAAFLGASALFCRQMRQ